MSLTLIFCASFAFVGLKAFQQLNVTLHKPMWVIPTSYALATVEIALVVEYARSGVGLDLIATVGTGSGLGCAFSMWVHRLIRR